MEFFNKKEEVLEVIMTKKGRELFSLGKFKPTYYSFHDNDIIYDNNNREEQNSIVPRIKEAPIVKSATGYKQNGDATLDPYLNKTDSYKLKCELGSKTYGDQYAPAWDIRFLQSPMFQYVGTDIEHISDNKNYQVSFLSDIDSDKSNQELIPQINIQTIYQLFVNSIELKSSVVVPAGPGSFIDPTKPGKIETKTEILNTYFFQKDSNLLVQVDELNAFDSDEFAEYEVEFYSVSNSGKTYEMLDNEKLKEYISIYFDNLADLQSGFNTKDIYGPQVEVDESTC